MVLISRSLWKPFSRTNSGHFNQVSQLVTVVVISVQVGHSCSHGSEKTLQAVHNSKQPSSCGPTMLFLNHMHHVNICISTPWHFHVHGVSPSLIPRIFLHYCKLRFGSIQGTKLVELGNYLKHYLSLTSDYMCVFFSPTHFLLNTQFVNVVFIKSVSAKPVQDVSEYRKGMHQHHT